MLDKQQSKQQYKYSYWSATNSIVGAKADNKKI